jgi:fructosamine-3-kinase
MVLPDDPLDAWLAERFGAPSRRRSRVGGGCIHDAIGVELEDGRRLFVKTNRAEALPLLEAEAEGLVALRTCVDPGVLVVPEPLAWGLAGQRAVLALPWLALDGAGEQGWRALGAALAGLHRASRGRTAVPEDRPGSVGWPRDNFIGSGPQANGWDAHWPRFFAERRLLPQLDRLARGGTRLRNADRLLERLPALLGHHGAEPCLVHGDLWSGNAGLLADGRRSLFDPAVHRGDREVDLAMARLFGGFSASFFAGYEAVWPLPEGHHSRVPLYNLYHLLNHANLFGGGYAAQAQAVIDALI